MSDPTPSIDTRARWQSMCVLAIVVLGVALIRFRLRDIPLERDEGEYAYAGALMLDGAPPYALAYTMKLPGTYAMYAGIIAALGRTPAAIHLGLIVVNAGAIVLLYLLGARLVDRLTGLGAAAAYALLSIQPSVMGTAAHATHFVVLPALAAALVAHRAREQEGLPPIVLSGSLAGLAFLMKQPGLAFVAFTGVWLLAADLRRRAATDGPDWRRLARRQLAVIAGAAAPVLAVVVTLLACGVFDRFWFWTVSYAWAYASETALADGLPRFWTEFTKVAGPAWPVWTAGALGLVAVTVLPGIRRARGAVLGLLACSLAALTPGLYFRPHYFILVLPAVALGAGLAIRVVVRRADPRRRVPAAALALFAVAGAGLWPQRAFFFDMDPTTASRFMYGVNPFPESLPVAEYLAAHTPPGERIAVLGSEPQLYFYAGRRSATGYIYTYGLMEHQPYAAEMQRQMIDEIASHAPLYVVLVAVPTSWLPQPDSPTLIARWIEAYLPEHYVLEGIVDILDAGNTVYRWGADAALYRPRSPYTITVLRRR